MLLASIPMLVLTKRLKNEMVNFIYVQGINFQTFEKFTEGMSTSIYQNFYLFNIQGVTPHEVT